jgi:hypothetical protein
VVSALRKTDQETKSLLKQELRPLRYIKDESKAEVDYLKIPETVNPKRSSMNRYFRI